MKPNFIALLDFSDRKVKTIQLTLEDQEAWNDFNDPWDFIEFYLSKKYSFDHTDCYFMECEKLDIEMLKSDK